MMFKYYQNEKKNTTNIMINSGLLRVENETKRQKWILDNKEAIKKYNKDIEQNGVFSDGLRSF